MKIYNINGKAYIQIKSIEDISFGIEKPIWKITLIDGSVIIAKEKIEILKGVEKALGEDKLKGLNYPYQMPKE